MHLRSFLLAGAIVSLVPIGTGLAITTSQAAAISHHHSVPVGTVYQTTGGGNVVLGTCGPPYPCVIATSGIIPEGSYSIVANVVQRDGSRSLCRK